MREARSSPLRTSGRVESAVISIGMWFEKKKPPGCPGAHQKFRRVFRRVDVEHQPRQAQGVAVDASGLAQRRNGLLVQPPCLLERKNHASIPSPRTTTRARALRSSRPRMIGSSLPAIPMLFIIGGCRNFQRGRRRSAKLRLGQRG
jgi:hypothetical protein